MGYIFEALTRGQDRQPAPGSRPPAAEAGPEAQAVRPPLAARAQAETPAPDAAAKPAASLVVYDPAQSAGFDERLVAATDPSSIIAEEYRSIRTALMARWQQRRHLVHTITSATPQEGKTLTSLNLGLSLAELRNRKTIVVEADLRLPQFQRLLGLPAGPGLVDLLEGRCDLKDAVVTVGPQRLDVLCAGQSAHDRAVQLLSSGAWTSLVNRLRQAYDHVIIDTPPVVELADAGIVGAMSDDVLLIARLNQTPQQLIEQAIRTLASYDAPVAGLIATDQQRHSGSYYKYRYGYRYHRRAYHHQQRQRQAA